MMRRLLVAGAVAAVSMALLAVDPAVAKLYAAAAFALTASALACTVLLAYIRSFRAERKRVLDLTQDAITFAAQSGYSLSEVADVITQLRKDEL